jgi:hypothetical protein
MKIFKKQFTAKDLLEVANDPNMRVGSTPFGAAPGERTIYIGRAAPWKGVKGLENLRRANPRVAAGLEKAISISRAHHEPGSAWVQYRNGQVVGMPMKCYQMMLDAGHGGYVTLVGHAGEAKRPWITRRARVPAPPPRP